MIQPVAEIWFADSEWTFGDGRIDLESSFEAVVFCLVGRYSQERHSFWAEDPGLKSFIELHRSDLFVAHNVVAEMKYLLRANIGLPERWFDTSVGWRLISNQPGNLEAGLISVLDQLGLPHMPLLQKGDMQEKILNRQFDPDDPADRAAITNYCFKDCDDCGLIYAQIVDRVDTAVMRNCIAYLKAVARMELRGIPVDTVTARKILDSRSEIVEFLIDRVNAVVPVYQDSSFNRKAFLRWVATNGIAWPWRISKTTGRPIQSLDDDAMKLMELRHPFISLVRQVRKTIGALGRRSIRIDGRTNRHFFSTWPFRSITGRNQPRNYIYSCPKWMRYLIVRETPDHLIIYLDAISEEVGVAAILSNDPAMLRMYETDDAHMAFAIMANAAPAGATKKTHKAIRNLYKVVSLGVLYGQTEYGISDRLGIDLSEARSLIEQHKELFPDYWNWSRHSVELAFRRGMIRTRCGWSCIVPPGSKFRTWMNWPVQATCGDLMRSVITHLDQQNVRILAPVHDGFLLSCKQDQLEDLKAAVKIACDLACDQVLNYRLKWDLEVFEGRYRDADGELLWNLICEALGALYRVS